MFVCLSVCRYLALCILQGSQVKPCAYSRLASLVLFRAFLDRYTAKTDTCKVSATSPKRVATIDGYVSVPNNNVTALMNAVQIEPVAICVAASAWGLYSGGIFDSKVRCSSSEAPFRN